MSLLADAIERSEDEDYLGAVALLDRAIEAQPQEARAIYEGLVDGLAPSDTYAAGLRTALETARRVE